jgi:hypothetical protein
MPGVSAERQMGRLGSSSFGKDGQEIKSKARSECRCLNSATFEPGSNDISNR